MPGSHAQHLRRKECTAAQGDKNTPFSIAEQRCTSTEARVCVAFMPVSVKVTHDAFKIRRFVHFIEIYLNLNLIRQRRCLHVIDEKGEESSKLVCIP